MDVDDYDFSVQGREKKRDQMFHRRIISDLGESVDFGFQAVGQPCRKEFILENPNYYEIEWDLLSESFKVTPSMGIISRGGKQKLVIEFTPTEASAIVNAMVLHIQNEQPRVIKVSGVGKYAYLQVANRTLHFDKLIVGKTFTRDLIIKNLSQVGTFFKIEDTTREGEGCETGNTNKSSMMIHAQSGNEMQVLQRNGFKLDCMEGYIPPQSSFVIKITFVPSVVGRVSIGHWKVQVQGGNTQEFSAMGEAEGFDVHLSTRSINFGEVKIGSDASRMIMLNNESDLTAKFQFFSEGQQTIFRLSKSRGTIKGKSHVRLMITFEPLHTICYHQRIFCIVQNHLILHIDLIGTCYDLLFKPLPLLQQHIDAFRMRVIQGKISSIDLRSVENSLLLKIANETPHQKNQGLSSSLLSSKGVKHQSIPNLMQKQNNQRYTQEDISCGMLQSPKIADSTLFGDSMKLSDQARQPGVDQFNLNAQMKLKSIFAQTPSNEPPYKQEKLNLTTINSQNEPQIEHKPSTVDPTQDRYEEDQNITSPSQIHLHRELFLPQTSPARLVRASDDFLDFGFQQNMTLSGEKRITIYNGMNCQLTVFWTIYNTSGQIDSNMFVFSVQPETANLKPNSSAAFNIQFRPVKNCHYFFQDLQFIAYKYSEKHTKASVDDFRRQHLGQSMKFTKDQLSLVHSQSQNMIRHSMVVVPKQKKLDYSADEALPPFCGSISCVGHSFGSHSLVYIPMIDILPSNNVMFKPCRVGEVSYQCIELNNKGDTPTFFRVQKDLKGVYNVFPQVGYIQPKQFSLLVIEFKPKEGKDYLYPLNILLNHSPSINLKINLFGSSSEPIVSFENNGQIFFPPSSLGVYSKQKIRVENRSKINVEFQIIIPDQYKEELYFEPSSGIMKQNEHLSIVCGFVPYSKKSYKIKPIFKAREILDLSQSMIGYFLPGSGNQEELERRNQEEKDQLKSIEKQLFIHGKGGDGAVTIKPELVDFGIVKVNFSDRITAQIINESSCTFYLQLRLVLDDEKEENQSQGISAINSPTPSTRALQSSKFGEPKEENAEINSAKNSTRTREIDQTVINSNFKLDFVEGIIAANSKIDVGITFSPTQVNNFRLKLEVIASERNPNANVHRTQNKLMTQKTSLKLKACGNYPLLKIIDVRNDAISVASLWENFQINKINQELATDLNEHEMNFLRIEQLNIAQAHELQSQLKNYTWNFGYLPNNKNIKPRKIVVTIQNIGGTELDFDFKLPSDSQVEVEPWADPGELEGDEAYEKAIVDRKIFQIIPKSGTLKSQQLQDIQLIYSPGSIDDGFQILSQKQEKLQSENHLLRVVLQINNGKPLVINLKGMTLSPTQGMLSVKQSNVNLPDCPIGMLQPLKYPIEIQNVGLTKLNYAIEVQEINSLGQDIDSKFQIFNISNRTGSLLPNEKQYLYCLFKPLEAKKYYHILTIKATDFMKPLKDIRLNVVGQGYSKTPKISILNQQNEYPQQRSSVSSIGSKVCFSIEEIDFGKLSPNEQVHRIIILYNLSTDQKLSFDFTKGFSISSKAPGLVCDDKFSIDPSQGRLDAGEFIELKLTLEQSQQPSIYSGEVECSIYWGEQDINSKDNYFLYKMVTSMTSLSSSTSGLEKETLFLRIKKESKLGAKFKTTEEKIKPSLLKEHLMISVFGQVISEVLNDESVLNTLLRLDDQPVAIFNELDKQDPANISMVSKGLDEILISQIDQSPRYTDQILMFDQQDEDLYQQQPTSLLIGKRNSRSNKKASVSKPRIDNVPVQDYRYQFLNPEFTDLIDLIMENTYFNIIQEATRKECDLLKVSKTFVQTPQYR